jgi:dihydrodipicolinate synthase/N-acetylneuraminate lyase
VHAEEAGAAAVMVAPPFYEPLSWRELSAHFAAVAEAITIPIMYYNLPAATGVRLTAAQLRELQGVGVTCLKDSGGDAIAATELIQTDGPTLLNGMDTLTFAALAAGVEAVVWGAASILPSNAWRSTDCSSTMATWRRGASSGPASGPCATSSRGRAMPPRSRPPAG